MVDSLIESDMQELQSLEQTLQNFLIQKQTFQSELTEVESALEEVKKTNDEVYRILSGIMLKADKSAVIKEFEERKKILLLRIQAIEKQEHTVATKATQLHSKVQSSIKK